MTDRLAGFLVTLEEDIRDDDAEATIVAIRQIRGVIKVEPVPGGVEMTMAENRARLKLTTEIWKALQP